MEALKEYIHYFNLNVRSIEVPTKSNSSEVYILTLNSGEKVVLKIPFNELKCERELIALTLLKNQIKVPQVYGIYEGNARYKKAMLLSYIEHDQNIDLTPSLCSQIGQVLAMIHQNTFDNYGDIVGNVQVKSYLSNTYERIEKSFKIVKDILNKELLDKCMNYFETTLPRIPQPSKPSLIHSDFQLKNILVKDNAVAGIIDFEVANSGLPIQDFSFVHHEIWKTNPLKKAFIEGYENIRTCPEMAISLPFFQIVDAFTKIAWFIKRNKTELDEYTYYQNLLVEIINQLN